MTLSRRRFLGIAAGAAALTGARRAPAESLQSGEQGPKLNRVRSATPIDRKALVSRHNPALQNFDPLSPLSIGNGEFAFTADITGLQIFPAAYEKSMPLCTMSQWGWHSSPLPAGLDPQTFRLTNFDTYGRQVGYAVSSEGQTELFNWLRENPHRFGDDLMHRCLQRRIVLQGGVRPACHQRIERAVGERKADIARRVVLRCLRFRHACRQPR